MNCSAFGLIVAIPSLVAFSLLHGRTQYMIVDINETSVGVLNLIVFFLNDTATTAIYPLSLPDALPIFRDMSHTPLFQAMFALLGGIVPSMEFADLSINMIPIETGTSKCDLTLMAVDSADPAVAFNYDSDLFEPATITRMIAHFQRLLEGIAADAGRSVWDLPMLDDAERRRVIEGNRTRTEYPREETLAGLFERQAARRGSETAVVCGQEKISYAELNGRANRVARELREHGVGIESRVGIGMERSIDMMVATLG